MNNVSIIGRINTSITVKAVGASKVANFLLSVQGAGKWTKEAGKSSYGSFAVEAWGKTAETLEKYCTKGTVIALSGSLKQDTWSDETGTKERVKIVMNSFNFVNSDPEDFKSSEDEAEADDNSIDPFDL